WGLPPSETPDEDFYRQPSSTAAAPPSKQRSNAGLLDHLQEKTSVRPHAALAQAALRVHTTANPRRQQSGPRFPAASNSFDHLVAAGEQCWRNGEAERLRRFQVDDQLEFSRLLHGEIARLRPVEDLAHKARCPEIKVRVAHAVGYQSSVLDKLPSEINRGQLVLCRQVNDKPLIGPGDAAKADSQGFDPFFNR